MHTPFYQQLSLFTRNLTEQSWCGWLWSRGVSQCCFTTEKSFDSEAAEYSRVKLSQLLPGQPSISQPACLRWVTFQGWGWVGHMTPNQNPCFSGLVSSQAIPREPWIWMIKYQTVDLLTCYAQMFLYCFLVCVSFHLFYSFLLFKTVKMMGQGKELNLLCNSVAGNALITLK